MTRLFGIDSRLTERNAVNKMAAEAHGEDMGSSSWEWYPKQLKDRHMVNDGSQWLQRLFDHSFRLIVG
ncbi:hypothetical protein N7490_001714 [Penicillium lividum]|nr:hypothetical protein N7490_001714 [Penicillium lividum]